MKPFQVNERLTLNLATVTHVLRGTDGRLQVCYASDSWVTVPKEDASRFWEAVGKLSSPAWLPPATRPEAPVAPTEVAQPKPRARTK